MGSDEAIQLNKRTLHNNNNNNNPSLTSTAALNQTIIKTPTTDNNHIKHNFLINDEILENTTPFGGIVMYGSTSSTNSQIKNYNNNNYFELICKTSKKN